MPKKEKEMNTKNNKVVKLTTMAMLTAIGTILQYLEVSIPIMPEFIKLDFSDLPQLIGAITLGAGVIICLARNIIHMIVSYSGFVGELSNFIIGASLALTAGFIHKKFPTIKGAIIGSIAGSFVMGLISLPSNYFIIYPLYYNVVGFPEEAILGMYQLLRPSTKNIFEALLVFNVPFTIVKGLISAVITIIVYKPLNKVLKLNRK